MSGPYYTGALVSLFEYDGDVDDIPWDDQELFDEADPSIYDALTEPVPCRLQQLSYDGSARGFPSSRLYTDLAPARAALRARVLGDYATARRYTALVESFDGDVIFALDVGNSAEFSCVPVNACAYIVGEVDHCRTYVTRYRHGLGEIRARAHLVIDTLRALPWHGYDDGLFDRYLTTPLLEE